MSKLTERLRRMLHADDRLDREMAAEWEDAPAGQPAPLPPQEEEADKPAEQPDWWITVPFRQGKGLRRLLVVLSVLLCVGIIGILVITAQYLPPFGHPENPANNEVSRRYIENGMEETGAVNIVAGMILDYRAFDTLGESNVLFTAVCAVMLLLRVTADKRRSAAYQLVLETDDRM